MVERVRRTRETDKVPFRYYHPEPLSPVSLSSKISFGEIHNNILRHQQFRSKHVVFGKVTSGMDILRKIETKGTDFGKPKAEVVITSSGAL